MGTLTLVTQEDPQDPPLTEAEIRAQLEPLRASWQTWKEEQRIAWMEDVQHVQARQHLGSMMADMGLSNAATYFDESVSLRSIRETLVRVIAEAIEKEQFDTARAVVQLLEGLSPSALMEGVRDDGFMEASISGFCDGQREYPDEVTGFRDLIQTWCAAHRKIEPA